MPRRGDLLLLIEASGSPFKQPENLISQPSTFFGTHASKRAWPRTLFALIQGVGRCADRSFRSCCIDPNSLLFWYSDELGRKKWSLGPTATLLKLWFESTAAFWRSHIKSDISSSIWDLLSFSEKVETAFSSNSATAPVYCNDWCLYWPVASTQFNVKVHNKFER